MCVVTDSHPGRLHLLFQAVPRIADALQRVCEPGHSLLRALQAISGLLALAARGFQLLPQRLGL